MKAITLIALMVVMPPIITYGTFTFIIWDSNPANWWPPTRCFAVFIVAFLYFALIAVGDINEWHKKIFR